MDDRGHRGSFGCRPCRRGCWLTCTSRHGCAGATRWFGERRLSPHREAHGWPYDLQCDWPILISYGAGASKIANHESEHPPADYRTHRDAHRANQSAGRTAAWVHRATFGADIVRVLWFTNTPMTAVNERFGRPTTGNGFWMHALIKPLVDSGQVELGIATATPGDPAFQFRDGAVEYFNIPQHKYLEVYNALPRWRLSRYLDQAVRIVRDFKPAVVHVHGTDRFFGLL